MRRSKSKRKGYKVAKGSGGGQTYHDYDPTPINPTSQQFEPTESSMIPRRAKQAGNS